ncbi:MAG: lysostaphin resistance A-like protein [Candidatus Woesearchaeota archaeon]
MPSVPPPATRSQIASPDEPSGPPPERLDERLPDEPPWQPWTAPAAIGVGFGLGIVVSVIIGIVAQVGGSSLSNPSPALSLIGDLLFDAAFVAAAIYFASRRTRVRPADFGFRSVAWRLAVGGVLAAGISYYVLTALYASALHLHGNEKLPKELGVGKSTAALVGASIFVCVIAPMAEEFFFRGFVFGALRRMRIAVAGRELGTWVAALITAILFGLAHTGSASPKYLIPLGFLGFVLCLLRWRTRSLYPCMALHSINNSLALGISQLHWSSGEILALMFGSLAVIAGLTGPLASRSAAVT